jgi:phosphatidylinositol-4,5-bisphosphate 3-kinase
MDDPAVSLRYALLLEAYLRGSGHCMDDLFRQNDVLTKLGEVANAIKRAKTTAERKDVLAAELKRMSLPNQFQLPLDPKFEMNGLDIEKCKFMDSKKVRLVSKCLLFA